MTARRKESDHDTKPMWIIAGCFLVGTLFFVAQVSMHIIGVLLTIFGG